MKAGTVIAALLPSLAAASPVTFSKVINGRAATVTEADLANFKEFAQWSKAAYCNVNLAEGSTLSCTEDGCVNVASSGATVIKSLYGDVTEIAGLVAKDTTNKQIVVSFRGSTNIANWITNLLFNLETCDLVDGCKTHNGFGNAWDEVSSDTLAAVASAMEANPDYSLIATGHSLGGAVATLAAAYLREAGYACELYTYGSPRVGNNNFARFVSEQTGGEYRVTHGTDPVPKLPPILFGFRHTDTEYWLNGGDNDEVDYGVSDIDVCEGIISLSCNTGTLGISITAHDTYFQDIGGCETASKLVKKAADELSEEDQARILQLAQSDIDAVNSGEVSE